MHVNWSKLDNALGSIYHSYLDFTLNPNDNRLFLDPVFKENRERLFISVLYNGKRKKIEKLGFETHTIEGDNVIHGFIYYKDLAQISQLEEVLELHYGSSNKIVLEASVVDIKAKKTPAAPGVWEMTGVSTDLITPSNPLILGNGGENVIVGIIDTGIDWTHENFRELTGSNTRILRVWDQGLTAQSGESAPQASYTNSNRRYGVEYNKANIDAVLQNTPNHRRVRHKDKNGHGTHVAAIAAGNGRAPANIFSHTYQFVGAAPLAKIVVVKFLELDRYPDVSHELRFRDAITYINKIGEELNMPVVINCSFGFSDCPHDGYSDSQLGQQEFLYSHYTNQPGRVCVFAIGNNADNNYYSKVTIPTSGTLEIDYKLEDDRTRRRDTETLHTSLYYSSSILNLEVSIKVPRATNFSPTVGLGQDRTATFNVNKRYRLSNLIKSTVDRNGQALSRNKISLLISPFNNLHRTGDYKLKIVGPAGTILHLWASEPSLDYGLFPQQPATPPSSIEFSMDSSFNGPADAENIITVGAYNPSTHIVNHFSSKGKIISYTGISPTYSKPDVSAPGSNIKSAKSSQQTGSITLSDSPSRDEMSAYVDALFNTYYTVMQGTSMAAPHIAGIIALMLSKNRNLTMQQIKDLLKNNATANFLGYSDPISRTSRIANALEVGAGMVNALNTINQVPTP